MRPCSRKPTRYPWAFRLKEKKVTIAAGFQCTDGIVLCADTELTIGVGLKRSGEKVWIHQGPIAPCAVVITGAGSFSYLEMLSEKIFDAIKKTMTLVDIRAVVEREVKAIHTEHLFLFPDQDNRPQVAILLAARDKTGALMLLQSYETAVSLVEHFQVLGTGTELGSYLAESVIGVTPNQIAMPVALAKLVAAYLLEQTKSYVPGCGKDSVIAVLKATGEADFIDDEAIADDDTSVTLAFRAFWDVVIATHSAVKPKEQAKKLERLQLSISMLRPRSAPKEK